MMPKLLPDIYRTPGVNPNGCAVTRTAMRAVIARGQDLLMIYSTENGDYKFPGGGVQAGETHAQALAREIAEECGAVEVQIGAPLGWVVEYGAPEEPEYDVFCMTSHYYFCQVSGALGQQRLDDYERDLGFTPVWVEVEEAIRTNTAVLTGSIPAPLWTRRDTGVLALLREMPGLMEIKPGPTS